MGEPLKKRGRKIKYTTVEERDAARVAYHKKEAVVAARKAYYAANRVEKWGKGPNPTDHTRARL